MRKAASWALRTIGKRSPDLNRRAIETAERLRAGRATRWVGTDALRIRKPAWAARMRKSVSNS